MCGELEYDRSTHHVRGDWLFFQACKHKEKMEKHNDKKKRRAVRKNKDKKDKDDKDNKPRPRDGKDGPTTARQTVPLAGWAATTKW